jgi:hypothetical protein
VPEVVDINDNISTDDEVKSPITTKRFLPPSNAVPTFEQLLAHYQATAASSVRPTAATVTKDRSTSYTMVTPTKQVQKETPSFKSLAELGLTPGTSTLFSSTATTGRRQSRLRVVVVAGTGGASTLVFRCELSAARSNPMKGSWLEKVFADVLLLYPKWMAKLNFSRGIINWYHRNEQQLAQGKYPIRMFTIHLSDRPTLATLLRVGSQICDGLNNTKDNSDTIVVEPASYLWLPGVVVWSDVIGIQQSIDTIIVEKGEPQVGFFSEHAEFIHTFFRENEVPKDLLDVDGDMVPSTPTSRISNLQPVEFNLRSAEMISGTNSGAESNDEYS